MQSSREPSCSVAKEVADLHTKFHFASVNSFWLTVAEVKLTESVYGEHAVSLFCELFMEDRNIFKLFTPSESEIDSDGYDYDSDKDPVYVL